ncbi:MAG: helix-turn-helix domain-containing protein [Oscillospiraceae bacterium]|nr:helix-turn-helix domain-containing protein [Oscillospiraceae bacterium]
MDGTQLGKKLKEARLSKKMTQSDVVGTFITRNMLSQIESGAAFPSLRTLEYLANTLEIPMHCLIPDNADIPADDPFPPENDSNDIELVLKPTVDIITSCKNAFLREDYAYVIANEDRLTDKSKHYYNEGVALLAKACLRMTVKTLLVLDELSD